MHKGLERLLLGDPEDVAASSAVGEFTDRLGSGLALEPRENASQVYAEQASLVEGLVRVYARRGLPRLLEEYEVLEVEREDNLEVAPGVILMARADGLLRKCSNGQLFVLSFKTAKHYTNQHSSDGSHDVQGLSESAIIESRLGQEVTGTLMVYLVKGDRSEYPPDSGTYIQSSPLVHPWVRSSAGGSVGVGDLAHSFKWRDTTGGHTLGKGWYRGNIEDYMPISEWITLLDENKIQPEAGDILESLIVQPPPYMRRRSEAQDWLEQTAGLGNRIKLDAEALSSELGFRDKGHALNVLFPQNRRSCDWPSKCPFQDICFGPAGEPLESGLYKEREPHHEREIEQAKRS